MPTRVLLPGLEARALSTLGEDCSAARASHLRHTTAPLLWVSVSPSGIAFIPRPTQHCGGVEAFSISTT